MNVRVLEETVKALIANCKGLLAIDESNQTCDNRFIAVGIPHTKDTRRSYREMIITTPDLGDCINGVILSDETIRQKSTSGMLFVTHLVNSGIIPGIKVDTGAKPMAGHPGETITEGLDGLRDRLSAYAHLGAKFAKWRAVFELDDVRPTLGCLAANAQALARYASLCQEAGLVPVVEPEVLMDGHHTFQQCSEVTEAVLRAVFSELYIQRVRCEGIILKPNMVLPGASCPHQASADEVADATVQCLLRSVPAAVQGIAFLSGGQSPQQASIHLNAIHARRHAPLPWTVTFSFARAIQQPALGIWHGLEANAVAAQHAIQHRILCNRNARQGKYAAASDMAQS
jgi:fructose-bisphosphate aldolase class I